MDQNNCLSIPSRIWTDDGCVGFATTSGDPLTGPITRYMDQNDVSDLESFIGDSEAAIRNALDCIKAGSQNDNTTPTGKVDASISGIDLNNPPAYPKCFWNLGFKWIKS